ncbi:nucleotide-binding universal stress UspA family protein [Kribbella orskensis]|uniref:Nucleotide-binding universal stress UspA family protein n=1 Tax=Kribbella orskensis TaxID=2512216 RepID=A0ABY2B929_9ACTN|nr:MULTISPECIES: universal stress protein [Kribbella]TCN29612.1 nucleotide-binding universal stress UspA family protein [Kribbella sp. VKM Ac-2500]TCO09954.1 nucleotide-binding universal stress UspA family protein [Kribbella orskensis]
MTGRFLVVVDDSAAAFHAAQVAVELAAVTGAGLTLVTVVEDHLLDAKLHAASIQDAPARRARGALAMVTRVAARAAQQGVPAENEVLSGHGAEQVLAAAGRCGAELIVVAREPRLPAGSGVNVEHLLEFADIPVLVVPPVPQR